MMMRRSLGLAAGQPLRMMMMTMRKRRRRRRRRLRGPGEGLRVLSVDA